MTQQEPHLTIDQLVDRWGGGIQKNTLAVWRSNNKGPNYIKVGSNVLYPLEAVVQYEEANTVNTGE